MVVKVGRHFIQPLDIAVTIAAISWVAFNTFVPLAERPSGLNEIFLIILGGWVTSKTVEQRKVEQRMETRVQAVEDVSIEAHPKLSAERGIINSESPDA